MTLFGVLAAWAAFHVGFVVATWWQSRRFENACAIKVGPDTSNYRVVCHCGEQLPVGDYVILPAILDE